MLRKALTLGMVVIFVLSLLAMSMITCLTYDAEADPPAVGQGHGHYDCWKEKPVYTEDNDRHTSLDDPWCCTWKWMTVD